jgi:hypothetical protein
MSGITRRIAERNDLRRKVVRRSVKSALAGWSRATGFERDRQPFTAPSEATSASEIPPFGCPSLCRFKGLLGCDPRQRHAVRTLGAEPRNPS